MKNSPGLVFILFCFLVGCQSESKKTETREINPSALKETLLEANKQVVKTEDQQIRDLITRYGWKMQETGTGLRYQVYQKGSGPKASLDQIARINYEVRLITGEVVYSSKESGIKEFKIGSGGVESGVEEAILLMRVGDKAKLILPSYLAYGLIGDQDRIPGKSTLIYDIELLELKKAVK